MHKIGKLHLILVGVILTCVVTLGWVWAQEGGDPNSTPLQNLAAKYPGVKAYTDETREHASPVLAIYQDFS